MYNAYQYNRTTLGTFPSGVAGILGGTAQVFTGPGTFHGVVVGTTTGTAFTAFDTTGQTAITVLNGSTAMILKASITENTYTADMVMANGLYVTFGVNGTYTVLWTKN